MAIIIRSIQMRESSIAEYKYPDGSYWVGIRETRKKHEL